jgi:transcriptional regulator with XRE-family HTH domain
MRRLMLGMSQSNVADALGVTFQQLQKYEKGVNRISASRLQHLAQIFLVPVTFFFEGAPYVPGEERAQTDAPFPKFVSDYLVTSDGLNLTKAFMQIRDPKLQAQGRDQCVRRAVLPVSGAGWSAPLSCSSVCYELNCRIHNRG